MRAPGPDTETVVDIEAGRARIEPLRRDVAELLTGAGVELDGVWLVGGVVRDALLDRPLLDVDLAVAGDPEPASRAIARAVQGTAFALGDDHGCWRIAVGTNGEVELPTSLGGAIQFDVCTLRGATLDDDLAARDFTANALAVALDDPTCALVDRTGGLDDLLAGVLRMVSVASLDDDPLRMLRAARIAHVLDWSIDADTADAIRERAARAAEPAGERTFAELRALLLHPGARRGWRLLDELGLGDVVLPELAACRGVVQSHFHHFDVYDHTLAVLDNCEDLLDAHAFWLDDEQAPEFTQAQRLVVLLAAICHDLGKPATRTVFPDGRIGFGGHDTVGMPIVDAIAERWCWSGALRRDVRRLVGTHLDLGFLLHTPAGPRERHRWLRSVAPVAAEAVVLSVGDRLATSGLADRRRWVRAHLELARALWSDHWREQREGVPEPLLDGTQLAAAAGIDPGPQLGKLVTALAEEQAVGAVTTADQAVQFARSVDLSGSIHPPS